MSALQPVNVRWGSNQRGTATTTSADLTTPGKTKQLRIINRDATISLFVRTWNSRDFAASPAATALDLEIPPTFVEVITKPEDDDRVSVLAASSTVAYSIMEGEGW